MVGPLISGRLKDVEVLAVMQAKPEVAGVVADAGAGVGLAALGVIERLRGAVVLVHEVALDVAERVTNGILENVAAQLPGGSGAETGH